MQSVWIFCPRRKVVNFLSPSAYLIVLRTDREISFRMGFLYLVARCYPEKSLEKRNIWQTGRQRGVLFLVTDEFQTRFDLKVFQENQAISAWDSTIWKQVNHLQS